jgi:ribosome-associated heat shock protein Hsp15
LDRQRIDKWLWHGRLVRTRTAAAALVTSGHVRVNGQRVDAASRALRAGDVVTVALDRIVRVLKVTAFVERRGSADVAATLYEDLAPRDPRAAEPGPAAAPVAMRGAGEGRPTKRDRRAIDRLKNDL